VAKSTKKEASSTLKEKRAQKRERAAETAVKSRKR
jgi:hypothetical protein